MCLEQHRQKARSASNQLVHGNMFRVEMGGRGRDSLRDDVK